jgi:hypothetical protein
MARNHWLKLHEQKRYIWTAEFSHNAIYVLKPRKLDVLDAKNSLNSSIGTVKLNFRGGMTTTTDKELVDFLVESRKGMKNWLGRLRLFSGFEELRYYELSDLTFRNVAVGLSLDDIKVSFDYGNLKVVHII